MTTRRMFHEEPCDRDDEELRDDDDNDDEVSR